MCRPGVALVVLKILGPSKNERSGRKVDDTGENSIIIKIIIIINTLFITLSETWIVCLKYIRVNKVNHRHTKI